MGSLAFTRQACRMTDETRNENTSDQPDDQRTGPTERLPREEEPAPAHASPRDEERSAEAYRPPLRDEPPLGDAYRAAFDDEPHAGEPRRLTRSGSDAIIGGVGSGLGRYFGVDPLLFRIGFVVLSFAGGFGVLAYLLLLAFMPADGTVRPGGSSRVAAIAGAVVLGVALVAFLGSPFFFFGPGLLVLGVVGLAGVLIWRALGGSASDDPARTAGRVFLAALLAIAVAGAALGVGIIAALGGGVVIGSLAVVTGLVLIGTAFVGGARWLIVPALALVLPLGIVAAADIDLDGGVGDREYHPASVDQVRDQYEIGIGSMDIDLRDVELPTGSRTDLNVDVGMGEALVYVPSGACVTTDVEIGAGAADVFDRENNGVDVAFAETAKPPAGRPRLHIDADIGVGAFEVVREGSLPDQFRRPQRFEVFDESEDARIEGGTGCA
jgi:phage shock protein PspC (stress-responsive transcriptional regulator)